MTSRPAGSTSGATPTLLALSDEAAALTTALRELSEPAWDQPTRCTPWRVRDVVGHVITVIARVPDAVAAPAPERAETTASEYFRADDRFSDAANAERVRTGSERVATADVATIVSQLADAGQNAVVVCQRQPPARVIRTRHGDAMLLTEFLTTRVFEVAVHGLDIADAVGRSPWLTAAATDQLLEMLFGPGRRAAVAAIGWDAVTVLRKATGRGPITPDESARLDQLGLRRPALG